MLEVGLVELDGLNEGLVELDGRVELVGELVGSDPDLLLFEPRLILLPSPDFPDLDLALFLILVPDLDLALFALLLG